MAGHGARDERLDNRMMKLAALLACVMLLACAGTDARPKPRRDPPPEPAAYGRRDDVLAFAAEVAQRRGWEREWVEGQLAGARQVPSVQRLVMPPPTGTAKNWAAYRARFIEPRRIEAGVQFWRTHEAALARAEATYGVPAAVVAGVIGVETYYGRFMGTFRTVDALATLAFDFPPGRRDRSAYFRSELEQLLVLARRDGLALAEVTGSYAGAIGLPQFMPGSVNTYAVDFDGDGRVNLRDSPADAIGSVANYLSLFGWRRGMPTHYAVQAPADEANRSVLLAPDIVPMFAAAEFVQMGAMLPDDAARTHDGPLALVELENGDAPRSYVAGTENFYVITRYNWSSYYALAVIELGAAVAQAVAR
jgi:membrane-bound lytic murein transglycosylase B